MPRANRYLLPGYVWHLTHRCHTPDNAIGGGEGGPGI